MSDVADKQTEKIPKKVAVAKAAEEGKRVYIGNIPFKATYSNIKELFEGFTVIDVTIPRSPASSRNGGVYFRKLGYAFAELPSKEEAERAVNELQGKTLLERPLTFKLARALEEKPKKDSTTAATSASSNGSSTKKTTPKTKRPNGPPIEDSVFVSRLGPDTKKEELEELFKDLKISEIKVTTKGARKMRRKGKLFTIPPRAFALVKFEDPSSQSKAIEQFDGKSYKDKEISVKIAKSMTGNDESSEGSEAEEEVATTETAATTTSSSS